MPFDSMDQDQQKHEGLAKAGIFALANGSTVKGELSLKGASSALALYSDEFFDPHDSEDITGRLFDGTHVSLINCVTMSGAGSTDTGKMIYHTASIFPHYVVIGDRFISSSGRPVHSVCFMIDDAPAVFYDFNAFGMALHNTKDLMARIVDTKDLNREIPIGDHPNIFYYTGNDEIISVNTVIGRVSVAHRISYAFPGPEGIHVNNRIEISIEPPSALSFAEAMTNLYDLLSFLSIVAGRPQNILNIKILPVPVAGRSHPLDLYWSMPPCRKNDVAERKPHQLDILLSAIREPEEFKAVLKAWIERHTTWRSARARFDTSFSYQNRYEVNRLVGAANMFDILPSSAFQQAKALTPELEEARSTARRQFRLLPQSPERDSILSALGRIGKPSLKHKIRERAELITSSVGQRFPELVLVVDHAVNCRNYYVHGTSSGVDYDANGYLVNFFVDTLEFVFAASDLVESGWSIQEWADRGSVMSHPFGRYRVAYQQNLDILKQVLSQSNEES